MPFTSPLPEWNKTATAPTTTKKNAGWDAGEKPPASIFDWFFNTTFKALQELQQKAVGPIEEVINGDANTLSKTQFYLLSGTPVNAPTNDGSWYAVFNILTNEAGTTKTQEAFNVSTGAKYTRKLQSGTWSAWVQVATTDKAQMTKLTNDAGSVKIAANLSTENILTKIAQEGVGLHTFYAAEISQNLPLNSGSIRGIAHITSVGFGWVWAIDHRNNFYTNYLNDSAWSGWKDIAHKPSTTALWTDVDPACMLTGSDTITPSKKLSDCAGGWMLVWCDADGTTARNYNWSTTMIPKFMGINHNGTAWSEVISAGTATGTMDNVAGKEFTIYNDKIIGNDQNTLGLAADVALRYVLEY